MGLFAKTPSVIYVADGKSAMRFAVTVVGHSTRPIVSGTTLGNHGCLPSATSCNTPQVVLDIVWFVLRSSIAPTTMPV